MRRSLRAIVTSAVAMLALGGASITAGTASAAVSTVSGVTLNGYEASLLAQINAARTAHGLHALTVVPGATDVARSWSWRLASVQQLSHNPSLVTALEHAGSAAWTSVAENVGMASATSATSLMSAYMASAPHRANILDASMRYVGVGVVMRGSTAWNTLDFVNAYSTAYGRTRVPAAGMTIDTATVRAPTTVATLENPDERFGTIHSGAVSASTVHFSGPTAGVDDYASASFARTGTGHGDLIMRDPLDLTAARTLTVQLAGTTANHAAVGVQVLISRAFGTVTPVGTASVGSTMRSFTFTLPAATRGWRDTLWLRVGSTTLSAVGGSATVRLYGINAAA
jgi:uncharacterized protein YkwD